MGTSDKLLFLQDTKVAIRDAIVAKGVAVPDGTTFRNYATKIGEITTGVSGSEVADTWVRPTEWLALPDNIDGVQKVSILNAVFDTDSEFVAFTCQGAYTVDWGDGVIENFATGVKAEHKYTYSNSALNSDTVVNFGYKQCVITITPQAGQNLIVLDFNAFHTLVGSSAVYDISSGFLDIRINSLSCGNLYISTSSSSFIKHTMLEQCLIGELADTTLTSLFYDCYLLQSVAIKNTGSVTSFSGMHYNNYSLQKMPTYTFRSAGVEVNNMFNNCYALRETYPITITPSNASAFQGMFNACKSLRYINLTINSDIHYSLMQVFLGCLSLEDIVLTFRGTGKITNLSSTFAYTRIKESPVLDTSLCSTFANAFQYCDRLTTLQTYDYTNATTLSSMLDGCYSLNSVPNFNITTLCYSLSYLCQNCWSLEKAPTFSDSSGVTIIQGMLTACKSLTTIPSYVFGVIASSGLNTFASGMDSLQIMPSITIGNSYTANTNVLQYNYSLKRMLMPLKYSFSVANAKMSASALNEMYSILPTVTGKTVTVTGNYGVSGDDPTIATAKGWTVTG